MSAIQPFTPKPGSNVPFTLAAATPLIVTLAKGNKQVRIMNLSANVIHVRDYSSTGSMIPVASTADYPIAPNSSTIYTKSEGHDTLSLFSTAGATGHATLGEGW